jgi:hypothetical protein
MATVIESSSAPFVENGTHLARDGISGQLDNLMSNYVSGRGWQIAVTVFLMLVAYDQCRPH